MARNMPIERREFAIDLAKRIDDAELHLVNVQEPAEESQTHGLARDAIRQHRETLAVATGATAKALATQPAYPARSSGTSAIRRRCW